jgi:hypothetical protein
VANTGLTGRGALISLLLPPSFFLFLLISPQNLYGKIGGITMGSRVVWGAGASLDPPLDPPLSTFLFLNKKVIKACEIYSFPFFSLIKMRKTKFEN